MNSIGEVLRRERLRLNLDLDQVARETKISVKLLEAIEAEDFSKLPGGVFTKSFVRQYARLLGMDEDEAVAELQRSMQPETPAFETQQQPAAPTEPVIELPRVPDWAGAGRPKSSALPALALVVVVMLGCSAFYAWWQQRGRRTANVVQAPAQVSTPVSAPAAAPGTPAPAPSTPAPETQAAANPPAAQTPAASAPQPQTTAAAVPAQEQPAPSGAAPVAAAPEAAGNVRVLLTAEEPTWISARSDGKVVYSGTLQANEKKDLSADSQVRLVVGNAGGVAVTLNGKPVPPLGPKGQVRVVQFSPGGVQIVPPKPPVPDAL
jgi:cytoskeletal protein RodZ